MADKNERRYVLGSGEVYLMPYNEELKDADEIIKELFKKEYEWGQVKNGATVTWTPTTYNVKSDLGRVDDTILTAETVTLALGLLTIGAEILQPLMETARKEDKEDGTILKIGGIENATGQKYFVGFRHIDNKEGDLLVVVAGNNSGELQFAFNPESETILNPTFTASALDDEGTKLIFKFVKPQVAED